LFVNSVAPENPPAYPEASKHQEADYIIIGPGSLYTSVIPNLFCADCGKIAARCKGGKPPPVPYLAACNIMTQPEKPGYTVSTILERPMLSGERLFNAVFIKKKLLLSVSLDAQEKNSHPVFLDRYLLGRADCFS